MAPSVTAQLDQARWCWLETAGPEIERRQVVLEVDVRFDKSDQFGV